MHSEHNASETEKTSASQTLVLSEDPKISPETTVLAKSPRALKRKKPRTNNAGEGVVTAENPSTSHLDDVSLLFLLFASFLFNTDHLLMLLSSYAS